MRRWTIAAALLAACGALSLGRVAAGETKNDTTVTETVTQGKTQSRHAGLAQALNLTKEQKQQIKPILKARHDQLHALRQDTKLTPRERREKVRAARREALEKIRPLLTDEQKKKLDAMPTGHRQARRSGGPATATP